MTDTGALNCCGIARLANPDQYAKYCLHLRQVFAILIDFYREGEGSGEKENQIVNIFLRKLLFTVELLRMKYCFDKNHCLEVDLSESGFPTQFEIMSLEGDLAVRDTRIKELRPIDILKAKLCDELIGRQCDPEPVLWELGRRSFFEMLEHRKMFLPFTPGQLELRSANEKKRSYLFSWATYDAQSNSPYIYILTFDQNAKEQPLEEYGKNYEEFLQLIKYEATSAPEIAVVAINIDNGIEPIHPKILKRICIGPLYSPFLSEIYPEPKNEEYGSLGEMMLDPSRKTDDFVLFFTDEIVMSQEQTQKETLFGLSTKVREIFYIPKQYDDEESFRRKASQVRRNGILTHGVLQQINDRRGSDIRGFEKIHKIIIDNKGDEDGQGLFTD